MQTYLKLHVDGERLEKAPPMQQLCSIVLYNLNIIHHLLNGRHLIQTDTKRPCHKLHTVPNNLHLLLRQTKTPRPGGIPRIQHSETFDKHWTGGVWKWREDQITSINDVMRQLPWYCYYYYVITATTMLYHYYTTTAVECWSATLGLAPHL